MVTTKALLALTQRDAHRGGERSTSNGARTMSTSSSRTTAAGTTRRPSGNVRWMVVALLFVGTAIVYVDRANLSAAAPQIQQDFGLTSTELGLILSGFFWTYAVFQLFAGWFVDKVGVRTSYT